MAWLGSRIKIKDGPAQNTDNSSCSTGTARGIRPDFSRVIITVVGISSSPTAVLVPFNGRLLISVVGSKIENKFLTTFSLFY
jgi:hypothetical protein